MKLLIAADIFPPESGGPATYAVNLANELGKQGVDVKIISLNPRSDNSKVNYPVYSVWFQNQLLRYIHYFILLFIYSFGVEVIYAMGPVNAGLPALVVSKLLRKKFVVKVVGDYAWEQWQNQISNIKNQNLRFVGVDEFQSLKVTGKIDWLKKIERLVVRNADKVIVPSQYLKKIVFGWGADIKKIEVIYNAVQLPLVVKPVDKPSGERWIINVGRLVPWKGVEGVMRAMKELLPTHSNLKFKIIGDGPERGWLENISRELNLGDVVEFLGNVSHDCAISYMSAADLVTLNSGYEGLSHTLLEARFLGCRAIASRVGGNPEVLPKNCLFPWNVVTELRDSIATVLARPVEPISLEFVAIFSFETMINKTKLVLAELINQSTSNQ